MCKHNIILTGFMGTGKTTVGKGLARELGCEFLDTDDLIENEARMSIKEIFAGSGEARFREIEKGVIERVTSTREALVLSTGGGAVIDGVNRERLKGWGTLICLSASVDTILKRVGGQRGQRGQGEQGEHDERPLLTGGDARQSVERLLSEREPFYNESDLVIDTTEKGIDEVVSEIKDFMSNDKRA